jgi:hypothetical protein
MHLGQTVLCSFNFESKRLPAGGRREWGRGGGSRSGGGQGARKRCAGGVGVAGALYASLFTSMCAVCP